MREDSQTLTDSGHDAQTSDTELQPLDYRVPRGRRTKGNRL